MHSSQNQRIQAANSDTNTSMLCPPSLLKLFNQHVSAAISDISDAKSSAVTEVTDAKSSAVKEISDIKSSAVNKISDAKSSAVNEIRYAKVFCYFRNFYPRRRTE